MLPVIIYALHLSVFFLILSIHDESKSYPHFIGEENETQLEDN